MSRIYFRKLLLSSPKLKNELRIAFGLILISLLVFIGYLFPGASKVFIINNLLPFVIIIALFIIVIGFLIIVQIVEPIIKITNDAKLMADGNLEREIKLAREDEIGELGLALNQMTRQIKDNVEELRNYSKQAESINVEVNKRILLLSGLIEISNLIAQNSALEVILKAATDKCLDFGSMDVGCLILKDRATGEFKVHLVSGAKKERLIDHGLKNIQIKLGRGIIGKAILRQSVMIIDKETKASDEISDFRQMFLSDHAVIAPITSKGNVFGLLIAGSTDPEFKCEEKEKEVFYLISKQIAIAITNELLKREVVKLEVTDHLTGLFNNTFTRKRLKEEIRRAASLQQPCSFALFSIDGFEDFSNRFGYIAAENVLIKAGNIFKEKVTKNNKAARFGDHEFALILPGKNKRESSQIAEDIRKNIEDAFSKDEDVRKHLTCSGVIAENPIDGMTADELILKSGVLLAEVTSRGGNQVAV